MARFLVVGAVVMAALGIWLWPAAGQRPTPGQRLNAEPGRFEIPGMDWGPDAAWRRRARQVRDHRAAMLQRGDIQGLNRRGAVLLRTQGAVAEPAPAVAVTGTFHVPVILIAFQDVNVAFPVQAFQDLLFAATPPNGRAYTLKTYYEQVSGGRIAMFGRVFDPVRTDSTADFYQQNCNGIGVRNTCPDGGARFGRLLLAVLDSISNRPGADTVWSRFDNDGPDGVPNSGDDDGEVDFVTFLQPVRDGACQPSPGIWAHRWVIAGWNNGSKYVTRTPRRGPGGQPIPGQFITVNNYTIQSQVGGGSGCSAPLPPTPPAPEQIMPIGTVAHETGHAFGLPDLYDTDFAGSGTEGVGEWGIMGSGNYSRAYSPTGYDAWSLNELGWVTLEPLTGSRTVTTGPRQTSDTVFIARTAVSNEYFLIENRQAVNSDTAMLNPANPALPDGPNPCRSNCRKAPGLLIWHIDEAIIAARRQQNRVNAGLPQGVALVQADGLNQLRTRGGNRGDHGDPFPGVLGRTAFTLGSTPAARLNGGSYTGFIIDQIEQLAGGAMRFRFLRREPSVVRALLAGASIEVNGQAWSRFEDVIPEGQQFTVSAPVEQLTLTGRTLARFLQWSNGGPRTQTITAGAVPDTLSATFAAEHRVLVARTGTGPGAVTASVPGDVAAGIFLAAGVPVTLTATPGPGGFFAGWRGDTSAAAGSLTLRMDRPYDLEASFVAEVAVEVADATAELLGTPKLTVQQRDFLDQTGNRNGFYDLGDYLALLSRNGLAAPPAIAQAAPARHEEGRQ